MSYISPKKIVYPGECCPALVTGLSHLLPFQVISNGAYMKMEYSLYGEDSWSEITLPITTVMTDGFFIHSYNGEPLDSELPCGVYEFRLVAGETWWFEPIMIEDFDITTNEFSKVDELMTPFKFSQQIIDTTPLIAPCDRILPFMFRTDNVTSGSVVVTMVDADGAETALTITVQTGVIDGKTYYWHRGECLYPFLTCGKYYLHIVDGANTYYSVPFMPECGISDIPDGYQPMRDMNGCVMRDTDGTILYEECSDNIVPELKLTFDNIINVPDLITDPTDVEQWNDHFSQASKFTSVIVEGNVVRLRGAQIYLDSYSFANTRSRTHIIKVEDTGCVYTFGNNAFNNGMGSGCTALTTATFTSLLSLGSEPFAFCSSLVTISLPGTYKSIPQYAFFNCTSLTSLVIKNDIISIGDRVIDNCPLLKTVYCYPMNAPGVEPILGFSELSGRVLHIPAGATGYNVWPWTDTTVFASIVQDL